MAVDPKDFATRESLEAIELSLLPPREEWPRIIAEGLEAERYFAKKRHDALERAMTFEDFED